MRDQLEIHSTENPCHLLTLCDTCPARGGTMNLHGACLFKDLPGIVGVNTTTRHDEEPIGGTFTQLPQKRDSLIGSGLLSRGEKPSASQVDDLLQGDERRTAFIESTVKSHGLVFRRLHQPRHGGDVDVTIRQKGTTDNAVDIGQGFSNVVRHYTHLILRIHEVAFAWSYQQVHGEPRGHLPHSPHHAQRGCQSAKRQCGTEFDTLCASSQGFPHTLQVAGTCFKKMVHICYEGVLKGS